MSSSKKKSGASSPSGKKTVIPAQTMPKSTSPVTNVRAIKERREERKQQERRQRNIVLVIGIVVIVAVVIGVYLISNLPQEAPIPAGTQDRYVGIPQTTNANGMPMLGDPNAPVQVVSYTSFACPACKIFHNAMLDTMLELIREGIMSYTIVPQENGEIPNGNGAARAALCAANQGKFFEYADALFSWQEIFANQAFSQARMFTGAEALGMNGNTFRSCIGSAETYALYSRANELRLQLGITGTPRTFIQGNEFTGGNSPTLFEQQVRQAYAQSGRTAVPLVIPTPDVAPVEEATSELSPDTTPDAESTSTN